MARILFYLLSLLLFTPYGLAHAEHFKELEQEITDTVITTKIKAKFAKHESLNSLKISVSTSEGIVSLKGYVKNSQAFIDALKLAKNTRGVKAVKSENLFVKQVNTALTDAYITAKVEAAVLTAKVFDDESIPLVGINATTTDGTVTLSGKVKKQKSIVAIIKRVTAVNGVKKVISKLEVNPEKNKDVHERANTL